MQVTHKKIFKNHVLNAILDRAINSLSKRFEHLQSLIMYSDFLNTPKDLPDKDTLK